MGCHAVGVLIVVVMPCISSGGNRRCSSDRNGSSGRSMCSCGGVGSSDIYGSIGRIGGISCDSSGRGCRRGISDINSSRSTAISNMFINDRPRMFITVK